VSDHDEALDGAVNALVNFLRASAPRQSQSIADLNLTLHQFRALVHISNLDTPTTSEVADAVGVQPSVGTGIVQRLVSEGLVERRDDESDRRIRRLVLSRRGRGVIEEALGAAKSQRREQLSVLSDDQLGQLTEIAIALRDGLPHHRG
jgi:DNA-binding MarR family transcriptional regulator